MDVVLEGFDTYLFDQVYAYLLPALPPTHLAAQKFTPNATSSSLREAATGYQFHPASQLWHFEPTDFTYMSQWPRDNIWRQAISLYLITWLFGCVIYFVFATLSYYFIFDHETFKHPRYLKNQIRMEIAQTLRSLPGMAVFTVPFFVLEVRGYSKMYDTTADGPGRWYDLFQFPLFLLFTDCCIYYIHRGLHHPSIYRQLHKAHHKWIMPTPFASHAFHPIDGFSQSIPYHVFPFIFPLQKFAYIALFAFINIWTVMIHDGEYAMNSKIVNGAACHTMHHLYFSFNYGQYTTCWDRLNGTYRQPNEELFRRETKMSAEEWARQNEEAAKVVVEIEGSDDRTYLPEAEKKDQ